MEVKELDRQIQSGNVERLYFFYGEEQFLMEHKIKSLKKLLINADFEDLNYVCFDEKKVSFSALSDELLSVPVMADKKMIVVKNSGLFNNAKLNDYKNLCDMLEDIPEYMCVVFCERDFDKKKEKNLEPIQKKGGIVKFEPLSTVQLERWLDKLFADKGKRILPRDIGTMIKLCGQSMANLFNEANKLISFVGEREKISAEDVEKVVSKSIDARIFDVVDKAAAGNSAGVFEELAALRASGENPSTILSLLSSRMGELLMVKQLGREKVSAEKMSAYFEPRRPAFVINKLVAQAKDFDEDYLKTMTLLGPEYTAKVRSGEMDKWIAAEMYVAKLIEKN